MESSEDRYGMRFVKGKYKKVEKEGDMTEEEGRRTWTIITSLMGDVP